MAAPAKPPINVCDDDEGMPFHQVNRFQTMAAITPAKMMGNVIYDSTTVFDTVLAMPKQRPVAVTNLKIRNIRFIDDNRNHVIDAGENSKVIFEIVNEGRTPVYDVVPAVEEVTGMKHIFISPSVLVEQIAPGEGIRYTATVSAGEKLKDGEVVLRVTVAAGDNAECDWQEFSLPTQKRIR